ncbi:MAG TPA: hypothetical protein VH702_05700 [Vicinamibacterales bacterium]
MKAHQAAHAIATMCRVRPAPDLVQRRFTATGPNPALGGGYHLHPDVGADRKR